MGCWSRGCRNGHLQAWWLCVRQQHLNYLNSTLPPLACRNLFPSRNSRREGKRCGTHFPPRCPVKRPACKVFHLAQSRCIFLPRIYVCPTDWTATPRCSEKPTRKVFHL